MVRQIESEESAWIKFMRKKKLIQAITGYSTEVIKGVVTEYEKKFMILDHRFNVLFETTNLWNSGGDFSDEVIEAKKKFGVTDKKFKMEFGDTVEEMIHGLHVDFNINYFSRLQTKDPSSKGLFPYRRLEPHEYNQAPSSPEYMEFARTISLYGYYKQYVKLQKDKKEVLYNKMMEKNSRFRDSIKQSEALFKDGYDFIQAGGKVKLFEIDKLISDI